ncbi:MAG: XdhC family protein [Fimbriimonadaceae bacterium]
MKELQDLIDAWRALPPGGRAVLATVVATTGSTYRKPGARMLVTDSGWAAGSVSGGCLEGDVLNTAWERTANGPALVTYDSTAADDIVWGFGLGCRGSVTVLFEHLDGGGGPLPVLARSIEGREAVVVATVVRGPRVGERCWATATTKPKNRIEMRALEFVGLGGCVVEEIGGEYVLFESIQPPLALTVFGGGHDAIPLVKGAKALGWYVTVVDHRSSYADKRRFPEADRVILAAPDAIGREVNLEDASAAVVMSHNYATDMAVLSRLLRLPLSYVGQLGPRVRTDQMLAELESDGFATPPAALRVLYAPVGLDLGGASPEEVALAVVAEIQAVSRGRTGSMLQGRSGPLHEPSDSLTLDGSPEPSACPVSP